MGWQILNHLEKLWVQIIRAKYLKSNFIWDVPAPVGASWSSRGITHIASILQAVVCRDYEGHILFVRMKRLPPSNPLVGEAGTALFAVQEAFLLPLCPITLEGDSLLVMEAINHRASGGDWQISTIVADIHRFSTCRASWTFEHVKREANEFAHRVAQWASSANLEGTLPISCIPINILSSDNPWFPP
ncbi:hypothetical protein CJ030_MR7G017443 [Morella rubra]|uniref:RNase H type-1 domain-containing protein n=1 Tax=Morella rubra TaxID=262757 RepID=A0A6A1V3S0_9ROSI|nr:hypothetical protein CJ030_MR7G017443 [Morella rubra]